MAPFNVKRYYSDLKRLFSAEPVVRHRIASKIAPPGQVGAPVGTAKAFLKHVNAAYASTIASYGQYNRLARYCIQQNTKVIVNTKKGLMPIKELVERFERGEKIYTYAYDKEVKEMVCVPVVKAWETKVDEIWKVEFDDGLVLECTKDHPIMLRDGSYLEARKLQSGDAVMPFHRKQFAWGKQKNTLGYKFIYSGNKWVPEHKIVIESLIREVDSNEEIHHVDFDCENNSISNLEVKDKKEHRSFHAKINNKRFEDPKEREKQSRIAKARWAEGGDLRRNIKEITNKRLESEGWKKQVKRLIDYNKTYRPGKHNAGRTDQKGFQNANADKLFSFQDICNAYVAETSVEILAKKLGCSIGKIRNRLKWEGYNSFTEFKQTYQNHKVVSVKPTGRFEPVYDLTINKYHNFAVGEMVGNSLKSLMISNSDYNEMESMAELNSGLDIYADEVCSKGEQGEVLKIESSNAEIRNALNDLFYDVLNIEFNAWTWVRNLCKYGDQFLLVDHHPDYGVLSLMPMPINEIEREEGYDPEDPTAYRYRWITQGNRVLEKWQVIHIRLLANDNFLPYGSAVLEPARRVWRQLILMEDAVMVYRIVRSPERRVFSIDVGNISPNDVPAFMEKAKTQLKRNQVVDTDTGRVDLRYNPLSTDEDYFIPVRGEHSSRIDTLPGGQFTGDIDDLIYIQNKLFAALKIPKSYLGYEQDINAKATLCVALKTKIPLLDGRILPLSEVIKEYKQGKKLQVYSIDTNVGRIIHGNVKWAGITQKNTTLVRLWFDNNQYLDCTPNHEIVMRNGNKIQAHELKIGDSIMPFNKRLGKRKYEEVFHPGENEYEFTHKTIALSSGKYIQGKVIHHIDARKYNNCSENLDCSMTWLQHRRFHQKHVGQTLMRPDVIKQRKKDYKDENSNWNKWIKSEEHKKQSSEYMKKQTSDGGSLYNWIHGEEIKDAMSNIMKERWKDQEYKELKIKQNQERWLDEDFREKHSGKNHWISKKYKEYDFKWLVNFCKKNDIFEKKEFLKKSPIGPRYLDKLLKVNLYGEMWREFRKEYLECGTNHKVVKVEYLDHKEDVGCLTIDNEFHNFAVSAGIFVGNSQEDVRFSRTIQRIQRLFVQELGKIAIIHLFSMGFNGSDLTDFEISMANPSTIAEMQRLELHRNKLEVASMAQEGLLDRRYVYEKFFRLTDEEIEKIEEGKRKDKMFDLELESIQPAGMLPVGEPGIPPEEGGTEEVPPPVSSPGLPPPPGPAAPITAGRDPNKQIAAPNELIKVKKAQKKKKLMPDLYKHAFNYKKTAMDPKRSYSELTRSVKAPFGEIADPEEQIFNKQVLTLKKFAEELEGNDVLRSLRKENAKKVLSD